MLSDFIDRLNFLLLADSETKKDRDGWERRRLERQQLRDEIEIYQKEKQAELNAMLAEKEAEIAQVAETMGLMDYADAVAESFGGCDDTSGAEGEAQ